MSIIDKITEYLPTVKTPLIQPTTREKIVNTILVIALYIILASIPIWGVSVEISERISNMLWVLGSQFGTLATLGVGPLVVAGILLQLLVGSGFINVSLATEEGRRKYDTYYKFLSFIFIIIESLVVILSGNLAPSYSIGLPIPLLYLIIFLQLFAGGLIIMLLDDFSMKYGITSGINIMIFAAISFSLAIRTFGYYIYTGQPSGYITQGAYYLVQGNINMGIALLVSGLSVFLILFLLAYLQSMQIEIPLLYINVGGKVQKFPLNLLYTSVIPAIFLYAIIIQIQGLFGFNSSNIVVTLLSPPNAIIGIGEYGLYYFTMSQFGIPFFNLIHIILYFVIFLLGGIALSKLWIIASGMDAETLANQLLSSPLFSLKYRDPRLVVNTLKKYIDSLAIISGALIGLISALGDTIGLPIAGISLLLMLLIAYGIYLDLQRQGALQEFPLIGKYLAK